MPTNWWCVPHTNQSQLRVLNRLHQTQGITTDSWMQKTVSHVRHTFPVGEMQHRDALFLLLFLLFEQQHPFFQFALSCQKVMFSWAITGKVCRLGKNINEAFLVGGHEQATHIPDMPYHYHHQRAYWVIKHFLSTRCSAFLCSLSNSIAPLSVSQLPF